MIARPPLTSGRRFCRAKVLEHTASGFHFAPRHDRRHYISAGRAHAEADVADARWARRRAEYFRIFKAFITIIYYRHMPMRAFLMPTNAMPLVRDAERGLHAQSD